MKAWGSGLVRRVWAAIDWTVASVFFTRWFSSSSSSFCCSSAFHEDPGRLPVGAEDRLVDEVQEALLGRSVGRALEEDADRPADEGFAAGHHPFEQLNEALAAHLGQGHGHRTTDDRAMADELVISVVGEGEGEVAPGEHGHEAGRLAEDVAQLAGLLQQGEVGLLHLLHPLEQAGLAGPGGQGSGTLGRILQGLELGDVDGVLDDERHLAVVAQQGCMDRRPVAHLHPAAAAGRAFDGVGDQRHAVGMAGLDDALEGGPQQAAALAGIGEQLEDVPAQQFLAGPADHLDIGLVGGDVPQRPVQHHVGAGQDVEEGLEVDLLQHVVPHSLEARGGAQARSLLANLVHRRTGRKVEA